MIKMLRPLKSISPSLQHIKLDKKSAESFPEVVKVLECHAQSMDYIIEFFKEPLIESCACKGCTNDLFKPIRIPRQVYEKLMKFSMPMPILKQIEVGDKSIDLQYPSFVDAQVLLLTNKFQPSLESTIYLRVAAKKKKSVANKQLGASRCALAPNIEKLKNTSCFKIGFASRVRGVLGYNNCMKPRCIYFLSAISQQIFMSPNLSQAERRYVVIATAFVILLLSLIYLSKPPLDHTRWSSQFVRRALVILTILLSGRLDKTQMLR